MIGRGVKLDVGPLWGSGSNQRWFDSLSTPYQILSLSRGSFFCFSPGAIALILLIFEYPLILRFVQLC